MKDYLQRAPFVRILLPLMAGILLSPHLPVVNSCLLPVLLLFTALGLILAERRKKNPGDLVPGFLFGLFFLLAGMASEKFRNREPDLVVGDTYMAILRETPIEKPGSFKAEARICSILQGDSVKNYRETILVYFSKTADVSQSRPGNRILFRRTPVNIENQGNPYEFNYKRFAALKGINRQVYLRETDFTDIGKSPEFSLFIFTEKIRENMLDIFLEKGITGTSFDLLSALTLGYRKTIDPEINRVFAATGATHVLSVSGLHVGILYIMVRAVFGFLRKRKRTTWLYVVLAFAVIWAFALITGFSPPVQRSALMFSLILIGENLRRPVNIYNTLAASACVILFFNPNLLYDIGFQLSYLALTGIVYFQPLMEGLFTFPNRIFRYAWSLFTVSFAAQLATFPLTCYYFHQFPLYFWLSGFVVVPLSFAFLFLGIALLTTSFLPVVPEILAQIALFLVKAMLWSLHLIERMPGALLQNFSFSVTTLLVTSGGIVCLVLFMETRNKKFLMFLTGLIAFGMLSSAYTRVSFNLHKEIIAYRAEQPLMHLIYGTRNYLLAPEKVLKEDYPEWQVNPVIRHYGLEKPALVAWEKDYADRILYKCGNAVVFDGISIWWSSKESGLILREPDVVVNTLPLSEAGFPFVKAVVVDYSRPSAKFHTEQVHNVFRQGARRIPIQ